MNFIVVERFSEAVSVEKRDARIRKLRQAARRIENPNGKVANPHYAKKIRQVARKHRIPGGVRTSDSAKVTFSKSHRFGRRTTKHGTAAWMRGYMHNPGATMHVAKKRADGSTKWYKAGD